MAASDTQIDPSQVKWEESPIDPKEVKWESARDTVSELKRQFGLAARASIEGVTAIPGMLGTGVGGLYNLGANAVGAGGMRFKDQNQMVSNLLTQAGMPTPETTPEKISNVGGQMIASAALPFPIQNLFPKAPTAAPARLTLKQIAAQKAEDSGFALPPSATGGNPVTQAFESFGGKAATKQEAGIYNQQLITDLAKKAASLSPEDEITKTALAEARNTLSQPYKEVSALSPTASKALEKLGDIREEMNLAFAEYNRTASRQALRDAKELRSVADGLESLISREAKKAGDPDLVKRLSEARTAIAKNFDVQRALNEFTGDISAPTIARLSGKKKLTGELEQIASFAKSFPDYAREGSKIPAPGVSALNPMASAALGIGTHLATGNIPAATLAGSIPLARGPVRSLLLHGAPEIPYLSPVANAMAETGKQGLLSPYPVSILPWLMSREE